VKRLKHPATFIAALALFVALGGGAAAYASGPTTTVTHEHGITETFVETGATCSNDLYMITVTYNGVSKESLFDDGRSHVTFTQTGTFTATPIAAGQAGSGHFTIWGGFNDNGKTATGTFTFNATGTNADGTAISTHGLEHFNVRPDGVANEFSFCRD
jgi:hypothetical protein